MDGRFPVRMHTTIPWLDLHEALIERYLPPDHGIRLKLVFARTVQRTTLIEYVERFQVLDSALIFAELIISDMDKVLQFIQGLQKNEDRRFVLERNQVNLTQVYNCVNTLRQAKTLASTLISNPRYRSPDRGGCEREIRKLESEPSSLRKLEGGLGLG
eukprot:1719813-Rhodomonas_salina.1